MSHPLQRYLHANGSTTSSRSSGAPYALVTGSTGGMGEEWAYQLAGLGFNVIIQGRNRSKLEVVKKEILSRPASKGVDVKLLVTEATIWPNEPLTQGLTALMNDSSVRLTIVVNNLGINSVSYPRFETETREDVASIIIANSMFPAEVTRLTLGKLKQHQPSLLVTITSMAWTNPPPYLSPYCGTKGFDVSFSRSLYNEMWAEKQKVDVVCMAPGQVVSGMHEGEPGIMVPTSEAWVRAAITSLRSTWWTPRPAPFIYPWGPQRWSQAIADWLPSSFSSWIAIQMALSLREKYWKKMGIDGVQS
ncbi:NAD(P)-binding protein [Tilletiaria anomala UBC 951]|uniref:NAD(P)-binding protein n=1 Tax=Tilletiaria anomala (strain ATCC 24038 / CBS 436.72 / UBC 951) TaxID=1037660 RepID=A0A066VR12_TILAU|nr:NAD(P)-binding protein [Tilletiaria anomala UBC 951]KDN41234.1 NAD(P)-binding protein [Tilletiaria anomala UBC 951]